MAKPTPLLQIIHLTDLHVQRGRGDRAALAADGRLLQLRFREHLEADDVFGWHEGTLGHDDTAAAAFERFLRDFREKESLWFSDRKGGPETWLIDTGDATTSGDASSMRAAHELLDRWEAILTPCKLRSLFGNHDAWPGTHPVIKAGTPDYEPAMTSQRSLLRGRPAWNTDHWLQRPLATAAANGLPCIECYALNTVRFNRTDNILALGEVEQSDMVELKQAIENRGEVPAYRILATHHPLAFPYTPKERTALRVLKQMVLRNGEDVVRQLLNASPAVLKGTRSPYIHLALSGHTHMAHPGMALPGTVMDLHQGPMGRAQAQLVGGSLMLLRSRSAMSADPGKPTEDERGAVAGFPGASVFDASQQFQILRFFFDPALPNGLTLQRFVLARSPNDNRGYAVVPEMASTMFVPYGDSV